MRETCQICMLYEATTRVKMGVLLVLTCHTCLIELRAMLKHAFKDSEAERNAKRVEERREEQRREDHGVAEAGEAAAQGAPRSEQVDVEGVRGVDGDSQEGDGDGSEGVLEVGRTHGTVQCD